MAGRGGRLGSRSACPVKLPASGSLTKSTPEAFGRRAGVAVTRALFARLPRARVAIRRGWLQMALGDRWRCRRGRAHRSAFVAAATCDPIVVSSDLTSGSSASGTSTRGPASSSASLPTASKRIAACSGSSGWVRWWAARGFAADLPPAAVAVLPPYPPMATIPQKELRNNIGEVLRRAEAGEEFTITVAGRDVARLGPTNKRTWVSGPALQAVWRTPAPQTIGADLERFPAGIVDPFA